MRSRPITAAAVAITLFAAAAHGDDSSADARVELADGTGARGMLLAIDEETVTLVAEGERRSWPLANVRRVVSEPAGRAAAATVQVLLADGGELTGTDFLQEGDTGVVTVAEGRIVLPLERVRSVAWMAAGDERPAWRDGLPAEPAGDVVVVRREDGPEYVECAIAGVGAESVSVVLDGETIPVKRAKILGLEWLREPAEPAGGTVVRVAGGRIQAGLVRWSAEGLEIDGSLRLPAPLLRSIDYAAGRTVPLATLPPERTDVEPFFGSLAAVDGLAAFFAPRFIAGPDKDSPGTLLARPRTVATWRVPADSRRFRAAVTRDVPVSAPARVEFVIAIDGRESFRRRLDAAAVEDGPIAIDCDVTGGRRLTITVDFVAGDIGCGVRLAEAAFEK